MGGKELKTENSEPWLNWQRRRTEALSNDTLQVLFIFPMWPGFEVVSQNLQVYFGFVSF